MLAHELWFVERVPSKDWSFLWETRTLLLLAAALAVALAVRLLGRVRNGVDVPFLARLVPWMPFAGIPFDLTLTKPTCRLPMAKASSARAVFGRRR